MERQRYIPDALFSRAKSLEPLGLHEVAWTRRDALELLAELKGKEVAVLGGDVYIASSESLRPAYDNWFCERLSGEGLRDFAERSQQAAMVYLQAYPDTSEALFALVMSYSETTGLS